MAVAVYLAFLARFPDSLIGRKYGALAAREVSIKAAEFEARLASETQPEKMVPALLEWDGELKNAGLNPGTSADLTAAALLILDVQERLAIWVSGKQPVCSETWDHPHTPAIRA